MILCLKMKKFRVTLWCRGGGSRYGNGMDVVFFRDIEEGGEEFEVPTGILQAIGERVFTAGAKFTVTVNPILESLSA